MLRNARELETCRQELIGLTALKKGVARLAKSYSVDATDLESRLDDRIEILSDQIKQYEALAYTGAKNFQSTDLLRLIGDLPGVLIQARIAAGWTQSDLARHALTTPQRISEYEKTFYAKISLSKAMALAKILDESQKLSGREVSTGLCQSWTTQA